MTYCGKRAPYPLFIYMEGKRALVVGAGKVAERKIATLREYGASVHVVAPDATPKIQEWAHAHLIQWTPRAYESGDISDAFLVFAATSSTQVNKQVFLDAEAHNCLCNVVDVPVLCNCIVPSLMRRGDLQIAVSSGGAAPTVAKHIRHTLEAQYPAYWEEYVRVLGELRTLLNSALRAMPSIVRLCLRRSRRQALKSALNRANSLIFTRFTMKLSRLCCIVLNGGIVVRVLMPIPRM